MANAPLQVPSEMHNHLVHVLTQIYNHPERISDKEVKTLRQAVYKKTHDLKRQAAKHAEGASHTSANRR